MAEKNKTGKAGIWIAILMLLLSLGGCVGGVATTFVRVKNATDSAVRFNVPGSQAFKFGENGKPTSGMIFGIGPNQTAAESVKVTIKNDTTGQTLSLDSSSSNVSMNASKNSEFTSYLGSFKDQPQGSYTVTASGPSGTQVAIAQGDPSAIALPGLVGIGAGVVLGLLGTILFIVALVRRSKAKKAANMNVGGPVPGGYPQAPAPGAPPVFNQPGGPGFAPPPGQYAPGAQAPQPGAPLPPQTGYAQPQSGVTPLPPQAPQAQQAPPPPPGQFGAPQGQQAPPPPPGQFGAPGAPAEVATPEPEPESLTDRAAGAVEEAFRQEPPAGFEPPAPPA